MPPHPPRPPPVGERIVKTLTAKGRASYAFMCSVMGLCGSRWKVESRNSDGGKF